MSLSDLRKEYTLGGLRRKDLDKNPITQFGVWFGEAMKLQHGEPHVMTLATADSQGRPSSRIVLLKGVDERGFAFFTNYQSRKGRELEANPYAALTLFWAELERQVCIRGQVCKVSRAESEAYYKSRPEGSRLAAWASQQSSSISSRAELEERYHEAAKKFASQEIPTPEYWGGYILDPQVIEFWQGRPSRLHDRFEYTRLEAGGWKIARLSP